MRKSTPTCLSEYEEQKNFVKWLEAKRLKFTAIPNNTWTPSVKQMSKNKAAGLRPGFPDLLIILPNGLLCIEMKRRLEGRASAEQLEWIAALNALPQVEAVVCHGASEAIKCVESKLPKRGV